MNKHFIRLALIGAAALPLAQAHTPEKKLHDLALVETLLKHNPNIQFSVAQKTDSLSLDASINLQGQQAHIPLALLSPLTDSLTRASSYNRSAFVRTISTRPTLCNDEIVFLEKRNLVCSAKASELIGRTINPAHMPRIAICGSGGSMRAALGFGGLLKSFDTNGILDTAHYVAGVSGSTWLICPWLISGQSYSDFFDAYVKRVVEGTIPNTLKGIGSNVKDFIEAVTKTFLRRIAFGEVPTIIDFWGLIIGLQVLDQASKNHYSDVNLDSQLKNFVSGQAPCPIYTAINPIRKNTAFQWVEFTPFEVMNYGLNAAVPAWGFGRKFNTGSSINNLPPLELGYLMGIWGSAISITLKEIYEKFIDQLQPKELFAPLKALLTETCIGQLRVFPAHIRNPTHDMHGMPDPKPEYHIYLDAGMDINIPFIPFLKPERKIDLIIVCDAGGDMYFAGAVKGAAAWAQKNNIPFPTIDYHKAESNTFSVFDDGPTSPAPVLIYLPAIPNAHFSDPTYDPMAPAFHGITSLEWTQRQTDQMIGLMKMAGDEAFHAIVNVIDTLAQRKAARNP